MAARKKRALTPEEQLDAALVPESEWPYEVPGNWCWTRLGNVAQYINGRAFKPTEWEDEGRVIIRIQNLTQSTTIVNRTTKTYEEKYLVRSGDLLFAWSASLGAHFWNGEDGWLNQHIFKVIPHEGVDKLYLYFYLVNVVDQLYAKTHGSGMVHITMKPFKATPMPLPPQHEQRRIASRIEWLFAKLDDAEAELREVIDSSERRQAAILHSAFNGTLTVQWRRKCEGRNASLIADIAAFAKDWKTKDRRLLAEQQAKCIDRNLDGHIWTECTVGAIGRVTNGSTPSRKVPAYWGGDIPWVSSGEVRNNIITETHECITDEGYNGTSVNLLPAGTVLIAMIGEGKTRGQSSILHIPATINQNVAAVVIDHGFVKPRFLWYWFKYSYKRNREAGSGTGPQALNCQRVRELPFILPEKGEQAEIVRRLDILLEREQQTQSLALDALEAIGKVRQAALSKALHGELGTNDPDEPSSKELLAGILSGNAGK